MNNFFKKISFFVLTLCAIQGLDAQELAKVNVQNESAINSPLLEFSPSFYEDGIVFISTNSAGQKKLKDRRIKTNAMSILQSKRSSEGALSTPELFAKELNSKYHEGPVCFGPNTKGMYFSRNVVVNGKEVKAKNGELKMNLYYSNFNGTNWEEGIPLTFNSPENDDCHPAIGIDEDKMIFSSDREGGFGGMDLYISYRINNEWSEPINLGPSINTIGHETFPFLHADNTLYFASDGHQGLGKFDMFYAFFDGTGWLAPANLGTPFNSAGDDFGLIVDLDKRNGYFTSNGSGGAGQDDIFSFALENGNLDDFFLQNNRIPSQKFDVLATASDADGKKLSGTNVRIINLDRSNIVARDSMGNSIILQNVNGQDVLSALPPDVVLSGVTDNNGDFKADLIPGNYLFIFEKDGYVSKQELRLINRPGNFVNAVLTKNQAGKIPFNTVLYNDATNAPLSGAMLVFTNTQTGKQDTLYTDQDGAVSGSLDKDSKYKVSVYKNGKLVGETDIDTGSWPDSGLTGADGEKVNMVLKIQAEPLADGTVIELPNIYYNYNDASLRLDARKDLDLLAKLLKQYPNIVLEIASHTDSRGKSDYNIVLSQKRAENVVEYLAEHGVDPDRLRPVGYGETKLRNKCADGVTCGENDHARNRRTEIKVLSGADNAKIKSVDTSLGLGKAGSGVSFPANTKSAANTSISFPAGTEFYVVAGSFLMENRANSRLEDVKKAGYTTAFIHRFKDSPFYSVCLLKNTNHDSAAAARLKFEQTTKIDSYVKPVLK